MTEALRILMSGISFWTKLNTGVATGEGAVEEVVESEVLVVEPRACTSSLTSRVGAHTSRPCLEKEE